MEFDAGTERVRDYALQQIISSGSKTSFAFTMVMCILMLVQMLMEEYRLRHSTIPSREYVLYKALMSETFEKRKKRKDQGYDTVF